MANLDPQEIHVAAAALRRVINETGYGTYVSDAIVQQGAVAAVTAVEQYRAGANDAIKAAEKARDTQTAMQTAAAEHDKAPAENPNVSLGPDHPGAHLGNRLTDPAVEGSL